MLWLYRPPQTYMPFQRPRPPMGQDAYNRSLQDRYRSSLPGSRGSSAPAVPASSSHGTMLVSALRASVDANRSLIEALCAPDVRVWSPALSTSSRAELLAALDRRDRAFGDFALDATPLDVTGDKAAAEWELSMTHTGPIELRDGDNLEPTGLRVTVQGATVADVAGAQIIAVRQYWDELTVFEQLGILAADDA